MFRGKNYILNIQTSIHFAKVDKLHISIWSKFKFKFFVFYQQPPANHMGLLRQKQETYLCCRARRFPHITFCVKKSILSNKGDTEAVEPFCKTANVSPEAHRLYHYAGMIFIKSHSLCPSWGTALHCRPLWEVLFLESFHRTLLMQKPPYFGHIATSNMIIGLKYASSVHKVIREVYCNRRWS